MAPKFMMMQCSKCQTMIKVETCKTCGIQTAECDCGAVYVSMGEAKVPVGTVKKVEDKDPKGTFLNDLMDAVKSLTDPASQKVIANVICSYPIAGKILAHRNDFKKFLDYLSYKEKE